MQEASQEVSKLVFFDQFYVLCTMMYYVLYCNIVNIVKEKPEV